MATLAQGGSGAPLAAGLGLPACVGGSEAPAGDDASIESPPPTATESPIAPAGSATPPERSAAPTVEPTAPPLPGHPPSTRSGDPAVDAAIDAVFALAHLE